MSGKFTKILTETSLKNEKNFIWCQHGVSEFQGFYFFICKYLILFIYLLNQVQCGISCQS
jgi:hypothetical protein